MDDPRDVEVIWYDGRSALRHTGLLRSEGADRLTLRPHQGEHEGDGIEIAAGELVFTDKLPDSRIYTLDGQPEFRLILPLHVPSDIKDLLPSGGKYGKLIDRIGLPKAVAAFAVVSAAVVAIVMTAPDWLGPMVPESWERRMGDAMVGDMGNRICHTPEGDAALAELAEKLDPGGAPITVGVANLGMVNAVALPGGNVVIFDGLLQEAESPEEVAGVLAHEIGHVRERHVMTALLRQFGISILSSGIGSGFGQNALGILSLGYSRDAESEADAFARQQMKAADVSPAGAAEFFERLEKGEGGDTAQWLGWIQTHPLPDDRAKAFRAAERKGHDYPPVLTEKQFHALQDTCMDDPDVEEFDLF